MASTYREHRDFPDGSKYHSDIRLLRDWIPCQVHRVEETKLWIYEYRYSENAEWNSFYSFPGIEFSALDWGVVNWWINTHPDSH
ncbi:hypothetical protein BJX99DRAFT_231300 [Aspergillus californicus]